MFTVRADRSRLIVEHDDSDWFFRARITIDRGVEVELGSVRPPYVEKRTSASSILPRTTIYPPARSIGTLEEKPRYNRRWGEMRKDGGMEIIGKHIKRLFVEESRSFSRRPHSGGGRYYRHYCSLSIFYR